MINFQPLETILKEGWVLLDVRSPSEYNQAHIPCSLNLPLLTDKEHERVRQVYHEKGQDEAAKTGMEILGPKLRALVEQAEGYARKRRVAIYCARGGMRSQAVAWLIQMAGFETTVIEGGYKSFRRWVLELLGMPRKLLVIGGPTGSGKTWIIQALRRCGEQVIDLESLAGHRGSVYGNLGLPEQPSQEHFENKIAYLLYYCTDRPIWLEHESRMIGNVNIPDNLYEMMITSPLFHVKRPVKERIDVLWSEYGHFPSEDFIKATKQLTKQLGTERSSRALECLDNQDIRGMIEQMIHYYDSTYACAVEQWKGPVVTITKKATTQSALAEEVIAQAQERGFLQAANYSAMAMR